MPIYKIKLLNRTEVANNTWVFHFEKPVGFTFKPGQYGGFTLIHAKSVDPAHITRRFSFLSAPFDENLSIATRIQLSAYKQALMSLQIGDEIKLAGPTGAFTLHENINIPAVFIAGGIGITPFYSMIRDAIHQRVMQPMYLFYGNQTIEDAAFFHELTALSKSNPQFKFIPVFDRANEEWQGERGYITDTILKKYLDDIILPNYYVCGSPAMVTALQELLMEMGIESDKIKVEDFPGY
ncbi:MAG: hypothetical protein A3F12_04105 [Gammaproteobacteria bacterium RIFCSPHIGHO2_12_FULL_38_14]|nr:MAG: hypothetical protein A3F12_04105 [Gammaproteobacteria bacterium RIFCSPHIGHO2_12_FULL_38_14]